MRALGIHLHETPVDHAVHFGHIFLVHKKYSARAKKREASQASSELGLNSNSNYESVEMIDGFYLFIGEMIA